MSENALSMKAEIHSISSYRALMITRVSLSFFLIISTIWMGILNYPSSPLYIFLFLNLMPSILTFAFQDYAKKYPNKILRNITLDAPFHLKILKKKYHYSRVKYISNSISFLLALILLLFWQYYCNSLLTTNLFLIYLPSAIITINVIIRVICILFYRIKLPYDLSHNRL